jgi:hypothetical protein
MADSDCTQFAAGLGDPPNLYCPQVAVNAINGIVKSPLVDPFSLNPLSFAISPTFTVTQNGDPNTTSQVYAVVEGTNLDLFFNNLTGAGNKGQKNQVVAAVKFPMAVLVNGAAAENSVAATLQITATCNGAASCLSANVLVDLSGGTKPKLYNPGALGINFAFASGMYEVQIPLLVNSKTDPFYFLGPPDFATLPQCANGINQISGFCNAFSATSPPNGFAPTVLNNTVVGMAPSAAPQCPGNPPGTPGQPGTPCPATLPTNPAQPLSPTFGATPLLRTTPTPHSSSRSGRTARPTPRRRSTRPCPGRHIRRVPPPDEGSIRGLKPSRAPA